VICRFATSVSSHALTGLAWLQDAVSADKPVEAGWPIPVISMSTTSPDSEVGRRAAGSHPITVARPKREYLVRSHVNGLMPKIIACVEAV